MGLNKLFSYLLVVTLFVTIMASSNVNANVYTNDYYINHTGNPANATNPSFRTLNDCKITLNTYGTFSDSGTFSSTITQYSPEEDIINTATLDFYGNIDCFNFGSSYTTLNFSNHYESFSRISHTATSGTNYLKSNLLCDTINSYYDINITGWALDSRVSINDMYHKRMENSPSGVFSGNLNATNFGVCKNVNVTVFNGGSYQVTELNQIDRFAWYVVFNSTAGNVNYEFNADNLFTGGAETFNGWFYYPLSDSSSPTLITSNKVSSGSLSLTENTVYIIVAVSTLNLQSAQPYVSVPKINLSIDIRNPIFECGEWSLCDSGYQWRECVDTLGFSNNKIEFQPCFSLPSATVNMGFENTHLKNVWKSTPYWWLGGCPMNVNIIEVEFPNEWEVNVNSSNRYITDNITSETGLLFDFMEVSGEEFYDGTKSLKMWNIPPSLNVPSCSNQSFNLLGISNGTSCDVVGDGNYSVSLVPNINKKINESYLLTQNITFDFPNMTISAYIRKCNEPVQQWAGNSSIFGFCGEGFYTSDKTNNWDVSKTRIVFGLKNDNTGELSEWIFSTDLEAWSKKELRLENLSTTSNYTLSIGLYSSSSLLSSNVQCAYIDNLELNGFEGIVPCLSYCDGFVRHEATIIEPNGCVFDIISPSPVCVFGEVLNAFNLCNDVCDCDVDSSTYLSFFDGDNSSGSCIFETFDNSSYCQEQCVDSVQLITPASDVITELEDRFNIDFPEWAEKLLSPIVLILGILAIAMVVFAKWSGSWEIATVSGFLGLIIVGTVFTELVWIVIVVIVVAGLLFASKMKNPS